MLDERTLQKLATEELIKIYGKQYLQENYMITSHNIRMINTCVLTCTTYVLSLITEHAIRLYMHTIYHS